MLMIPLFDDSFDDDSFVSQFRFDAYAVLYSS